LGSIALAGSACGIFLALVMQLVSNVPQWVTGHRSAIDQRTGIYIVMRYDVAGILFRVPDMDRTELERGGYDVDALTSTVEQYYSGERTDFFDAHLGDNPRAANFAVPIQSFSDLFDSMVRIWARAVMQYPKAYLSHRFESFSWLIGLRDESKCIPVIVGRTEGPPDMRAALGLDDPVTQRDTVILETLFPLTHTFIYRHWVYMLLNCGILLFCALRFRPGDEAILGLSATAILITISFLPIGLACDFRYLYLPMIACPFSLLMRARGQTATAQK
jgi:hypothetical protein